MTPSNPRRRVAGAVAAAIAVTVLLVARGGDEAADPEPPTSTTVDTVDVAATDDAPVAAQLDVGRHRWEQAGLDDYTFTIEYDCPCTEEFRGPYAVTVEDGVVTDFHRLDGGPSGFAEEFPTIDELFATATDALADRDADVLHLALDPELGHPTELGIDRDLDRRGDEYVVFVSDVRPIAGTATPGS